MKGRSPWRVGRKVGRTLYDADDVLIGVMDTPELAALVVAAVNATHGAPGSGPNVASPLNRPDVDEYAEPPAGTRTHTIEEVLPDPKKTAEPVDRAGRKWEPPRPGDEADPTASG